jgi:hypothetical protein
LETIVTRDNVMTVDGVEVEPDKAESTPFFHASRTLQLAKNIPNQASA